MTTLPDLAMLEIKNLNRATKEADIFENFYVEAKLMKIYSKAIYTSHVY